MKKAVHHHMLFCFNLLILSTVYAAEPRTAPTERTVRVAITGGIADNDFWQELSSRFEKQTGIRVETAAAGNKDALPSVFKKGGIDLIAMYSSDAMMNLVSDGYATDARPWLSSDLILVGPANDPAGVRAMPDAASAFMKIAEKKSPLVIHGSLGADVIARTIIQEDGIELDPSQLTVLLDDHQRQVLQFASEKKAYTLIAKVPYRSGKLPSAGQAVMVEGDPRLRRPYLLAVANPVKISGVHAAEASRLAEFLRSTDVQTWIGGFNKDKFGAGPEFNPVFVNVPTTRPAGSLADVRGEIPRPLAVTTDLLKSLPRTESKVKNERGDESTYSGVLVSEVLKAAGAPIGNHQFRGPHARLAVFIGAADGYVSSFSLAEFDEDFGQRAILLSDQKNGKPLENSEGPLRVIVPQDQRQARWVRQVAWIEVR